MIFIYLYNNSVIASETAIKDSKYEQLETVKNIHNVDTVLKKYEGKYTIDNRINPKRLFDPRKFSPEVKQKQIENMVKAITGLKKSETHRMAMSLAKKGKASNFKGKKHSEYSKQLIKAGRGTRDPINGRKWCHDPLTGKEKRVFELPEGFRWGRTPEMNDWLGR